MRNIKIRKLDKYDGEDYKEIAFGVYQNKKADMYSFSYEATLEEGEGQYPLEDLLDKYNVSCGDFCGDEEIIDGERVSYVEVNTLNCSLDNLISILNYATIVGKIIENVNYKSYVYLVKRYNNAKIKFNGNEYSIPIYAKRNMNSNTDNFEIQYPEKNYENYFRNLVELPENMENYEPKFVMIEDKLAKVVCENNELGEAERSNKQVLFVYNLKGFVEKEGV